MTHEVHLPQGTIRYRSEGDGEPLLFIHGIVVNGDLWRKVVPRLSGDFRCIAPDWPLGAHSVAMAPGADFSLPGLAQLVVDFMDAIGLETATLVGNDSGGAIAQMVAVDHPDRVTRLVLNSSELYEYFLPPLFKPLQLAARVPGSLWLVSQLLRARFAQRLPMAYGWSIKSGLPERAIMDSYLGPAERRRTCGATCASSCARWTRASRSTPPRGSRPSASPCCWRGPRTTGCSRSSSLAASRPPCRTARLELIPDSYTFVPEDQPAALADAIASLHARAGHDVGVDCRPAPGR